MNTSISGATAATTGVVLALFLSVPTVAAADAAGGDGQTSAACAPWPDVTQRPAIVPSPAAADRAEGIIVRERERAALCEPWPDVTDRPSYVPPLVSADRAERLIRQQRGLTAPDTADAGWSDSRFGVEAGRLLGQLGGGSCDGQS